MKSLKVLLLNETICKRKIIGSPVMQCVTKGHKERGFILRSHQRPVNLHVLVNLQNILCIFLLFQAPKYKKKI